MDARSQDDRRDDSSRIARRAVERLAEGRSDAVGDAVDDAARELRARSGFRRPTRSELRAHAQAHEESTGPGVRSRRIAATLEEALDVLSALEACVISRDPEGPDRPSPEIHGRAALGELDLDPCVHVRVVTTLPVGTLAAALVDAGLAEPSFSTLESRYGRLDRIAADGAFAEYRIVRIPPALKVDPDRDLIDGARIAHGGFEAISLLVGGLGHPDP